jgi:hypothetical protein
VPSIVSVLATVCVPETLTVPVPVPEVAELEAVETVEIAEVEIPLLALAAVVQGQESCQ